MVTCNTHYLYSKVTLCEKLHLESYLWLQKLWIILQRSPTGISVWNRSPSLKASQLMNQARVPSRGTRWGSLFWSLWPYCTSTSRTTGNTLLRSFREVREGIFLNIVHSSWVGWALPHSFISNERRWQRLLLTGWSFTPYANFDSARVGTLPGSCPHVPAVVAWEVQTKWLCQRKQKSFIYISLVWEHLL